MSLWLPVTYRGAAVCHQHYQADLLSVGNKMNSAWLSRSLLLAKDSYFQLPLLSSGNAHSFPLVPGDSYVNEVK